MVISIKRFIKLILSQIIIGVLGLSIGSFIGITHLLQSYSNRLFTHTTINNIDVSSTTFEEAYTLVTKQYIEPLLQNTLSLTYQGTTTEIPFSELISGNNLEDVIDSAFELPTKYTFLQKYMLLKENQTHDYQIEFTIDEAAIKRLVTSFTLAHCTASSDASIQISHDGHITITPSTDAISWKTSDIISDIHSLLMKRTSIVLDMEQYKIVNPAQITTEMLEQIDTRVSRYTTKFKADSGNEINISLAASTINGTLLFPGDTFSFNDIIGDTTLEKGYTYAPVIANSRFVQGVGGGVCQVSSTLYNAILLAGLTASQRSPHSKPSSYVPLGQDATIDWGNIDFQFINTLDYPLYICSYTQNDKLFMDLYSNSKLTNTTYIINSNVYKRASGYYAKVTREKYQNNQLIDTTIISDDVYHTSSNALS